MGKTEDAFGKKRDHNQYGEVEKSRKDILYGTYRLESDINFTVNF